MLLKNFSLLTLQAFLPSKTPIFQVKDPNQYCIYNEEVDVYNWDVPVPNCIEVRIEGNTANFEEIFDISWDNGNKRNVVAWLEAENVWIDEKRDEDCVEDEKDSEDASLGKEGWRFGYWPDEGDEFIDY